MQFTEQIHLSKIKIGEDSNTLLPMQKKVVLIYSNKAKHHFNVRNVRNVSAS